MKKALLVILFGGLLLIVPAISTAQFSLSLAPTTGLNFNIHSGSDIEQTGTGIGFVIGGEVDMSFTRTIGMIGRFNFYDNRSGSYSKSGTENNVNYTQDYSASIAYFQIEPLFKMNLPQTSLFFVAGPSVGFNVEGSGEVTTKITTQGVTFQDGTTSRKAKSSFKDMLVRFEIKFGAGYDIEITKKMSITPQLSFGYGITKVMSDVNWRILTIQSLCSVKFKLI